MRGDNENLSCWAISLHLGLESPISAENHPHAVLCAREVPQCVKHTQDECELVSRKESDIIS